MGPRDVEALRQVRTGHVPPSGANGSGAVAAWIGSARDWDVGRVAATCAFF